VLDLTDQSFEVQVLKSDISVVVDFCPLVQALPHERAHVGSGPSARKNPELLRVLLATGASSRSALLCGKP
jgi:hypothetical protein